MFCLPWVREARVQAENAFKEKRLADAAAHYEDGLKINPVWPEDYFNAALIYAELQDWDKAIWHMRAYVELVPDAPDARTGRGQLYVWRDKLKVQETVGWRDPATALLWAKQDNGSKVDWNQANSYCQNLSLGGYSGWRLPSIEDLATLYDEKQNVNGMHIKGGIKLSGGISLSDHGTGVWSATGSHSEPGRNHDTLNFSRKSPRRYGHPDNNGNFQAVCVRRSGE